MAFKGLFEYVRSSYIMLTSNFTRILLEGLHRIIFIKHLVQCLMYDESLMLSIIMVFSITFVIEANTCFRVKLDLAYNPFCVTLWLYNIRQVT